MDSTQELILAELRALRDDLNGFTRSIGERMATVETQMYTLVGNGQPGRVGLLERSVQKLQEWRWKMLGVSAGVGGVASLVAWLLTPHK
jgi:hypothetical protein